MSSAMLGSSATSPADTVVQGNLLVKGGITAASSIAPSANITGDLTVGGTSTLTGPVVAGATIVAAGLVTANAGLTVSAGTSTLTGPVVAGSTIVAAGQITANAGLAVSAGNLAVAATSNLGVVNSSASVSALSFSNSSLSAPVTVQIVTAGVAGAGVTTGSSGTGNNSLTMVIPTIFPGAANLKAYRIYLSGSATDRYSGWGAVYSGAVSAGLLTSHFQSFSGFQPQGSYKGSVDGKTIGLGAGGGGPLGINSDNQIVFAGDLTAGTMYWGCSADNGGVIGLNTSGTNLWLTIVPVL